MRAVDDVSFSVPAGQCFGIVGESGSGKTTVAKMLLGLVQPTSGSIQIDGIDTQASSRAQRAALHRTIQVVFQDPYSSMNPRLRISRIVGFEESFRPVGFCGVADIFPSLRSIVARRDFLADRQELVVA